MSAVEPLRAARAPADLQADAERRLRAAARLERRATRGGALALWTLLVLFSAVAAHVGAILVMPHVAPQDAFARLAALAPRATTTPLPAPAPGKELAPFNDPAAAIAFCRYDLADGPLRIHAEVDGENFLSLSFRSKTNASFYALTDSAAQKGALDALVVTQAQLDEIEAGEAQGDEDAGQTRIVSPTREGFVLMRALAPTPAAAAEAAQRLRAVACDVAAMDEPQDE
jgi:uncharacterized membrane protein